MKLSNKKIKYIKRHASKKTPEEIARDLSISIKDVQRVLRPLNGGSQNNRILIPETRNNLDSTYKFHLIVAFSIALLCIIIYSNTFNSPFVFDDFPNIKKNPYFRLIDPDFQRLYDAGFKSPNPTRPVANISFALNYYFGKYDVKGYHVVNITIHIINGILVYLLALIIFQQASLIPNQTIPQFKGASIPIISFFTALIFISHPVQTQSAPIGNWRL